MSYGEESAPLAIAHRGGAGLAPENTLSAFALSTALGLRYVESDVRLTADGELVCFHDEMLDRCTTGTGRLAARTSKELRAGVRVGGTEPIPTLREALETFPDTCFTVDLKDRAAIAPMARLLQRRSYAERVCVAGAWDGWLQLLASQAPHVRTALGWRSLVTLVSAAKAGVQPPASVVRGGSPTSPSAWGRWRCSRRRSCAGLGVSGCGSSSGRWTHPRRCTSSSTWASTASSPIAPTSSAR